MKKIKLGSKTFSILNHDSIQRFESHPVGLLLSTFLLTPLVLILLVISINIYKPIISIIYILFIIGLSSFILFGTRIFKKKIVINRKDKTITCSLLFSKYIRASSFFSLTIRNKVKYKFNEHSIKSYLTDYIIIEDSLKLKNFDYIIYKKNNTFLKDLEFFIFYSEDKNSDDLEIQIKNSKNPNDDINLFYLRRSAYFFNNLNNRDLAKEDILTSIYNLKSQLSHTPKESLLLAESYEIFARILEQEGDLEKSCDKLFLAMTYAKQIMDIRNEYYIDLLSKLGRSYLQIQHYTQSKISFLESYDLKGDPEDAYGLYLCYLAEKDYKNAEHYIFEAYNCFYNPEYLILLADFYLAMNQREKAVELINEALENIYADESQEELDLIHNYRDELSNRTITTADILTNELVNI